jgi:hypothetical protein
MPAYCIEKIRKDQPGANCTPMNLAQATDFRQTKQNQTILKKEVRISTFIS